MPDIIPADKYILPPHEAEEADAISEMVKDFQEKMAQTNDNVISPAHYTKGGVECIKAIEASMSAEAFCGYLKGNVMKYVYRYEQKGGVESLEKARVYLDWLIKKVNEEIA